MTPGVLATRNAHALNRTMAAAQTLAERFALPLGELHPSARDPQAAALFQREAVADLLEALVSATERSVEGVTQSFTTAAESPLLLAVTRPGDLTVAEMREQIEQADELTLQAMEHLEQDGKERKGVFEAIEARRAELAEEGNDQDGDGSEELSPRVDDDGRPLPPLGDEA